MTDYEKNATKTELYYAEIDDFETKYKFYNSQTSTFIDCWDSVVDLMSKNALNETFSDETWIDGDIVGFLEVYSKYHKEITGCDWNIVYIEK